MTEQTGQPELLEAAWDSIRQKLRQAIGARSFDHWLKPLTLGGFSADDGQVTLHVPSEFMASWIRSHHGDRLLHSWRDAVPHVRAIRIEVAAARSTETYSAKSTDSGAAEPAQPGAANEFDARLTFARFVTGPANAVAVNAAKTLAAGGPLTFSPLYIHSQTGQGKTHLLHAIGHEVLRLKPGTQVRYMSAERFMLDFVAAVRAKDTLGFKAKLRSTDLLMIDDVQFIAGKETTQEEFLHTVDELMRAGRKLVISADRAPHALDGVEGRVLSRLTQGLVVDIQPADFMLRRSIIKAKAAEIEGPAIGEEVLDLLAARIVSNIRELEGALNRLVAYASLGSEPVTIAFAEHVLADMFRASRRRITIDEIQRRVSEHFRIKQSEMLSARRAREVARPRQIAMYLAKQLTPRSLPEIGRRFGGRDHTTVIHAVRQIEKLRGQDNEIDNDVRTLLRLLEG